MRGPKTTLTLQTVAKTVDDLGGYTETWTDSTTIKGVLTNTSGYERMVGAGKEQEANQFAQEFLIPFSEYQAFLQNNDLSQTAIRLFAEKLGIAPGIVVGRLQHDKVIPYSTGNRLKKRFRFREEA